jgi:hypothetical protein
MVRSLNGLSTGATTPVIARGPSSSSPGPFLHDRCLAFCKTVSPRAERDSARLWLNSRRGPYVDAAAPGIARGSVVPVDVERLDIPYVGGMSSGLVNIAEFSNIQSASELFLPVEDRDISAAMYSDPAFRNNSGVREMLAVRLIENGLCKLSQKDARAMGVSVFAVSKDSCGMLSDWCGTAGERTKPRCHLRSSRWGLSQLSLKWSWEIPA